MSNKNLMMVNGKDVDNPAAYLQINLADDKAEVRGFGQAVTRAKARSMADSYFKDCEAAWKIVDQIDKTPAYQDLKNQIEFSQLKNLLDPTKQTVSGVFGKEIILQILSMRNCEGIRYIQGKDGQKNTIILIGVAEVGTTTVNGVTKAESAPVTITSVLHPTLTPGDIPVDGEVHEESLTIDGVRTLLREKHEIYRDVNDVLFGAY